MGIWNKLEKAFFPGHFRWHEPVFFGMRLRKELGSRLLLAGSVVLLVFGASSVLPVSLEGLLVLGLFLGCAVGMLVFLWPEVQVKWVTFLDDAIECRWTTYWGYWYVVHEQRFRYDTIVRAVIVPAEALGNRFSLLALATPLTIQTLGISRQTDPQEVGNFLASHGVEVSYCQELPPRALPPSPYPRWPTPAAAVTGVILLLTGMIINPTRPTGNQDQARVARPEGLTRPRPPMDQEEPDVPRWPGQEKGFQRDLLRGGRPFGAAQPQQQAAQPEPAPGGVAGAEGPPPGMAFGPRMPGRNPRGMGSRPGLPPGIFGGPAMPGEAEPQPALPRGTGTEIIGGTGGMPYQAVGSGGPVLGFRYAMGSWAGEAALAELEPLYAAASDPAPQQVIARQGYAVGALEIDAPKYVSAVRIVFMRLGADGRLDPKDSYPSEWIGTPSGKPPRTVGGDGKKVIGVQARRAAVLDAVGLVME